MDIEDLATVMITEPNLLSLEEICMLLLSDCENVEVPTHTHYKRLDLDNLSSEEFKNYFRFAKEDIERLAVCLHIKDKYKSCSRLRWDGIEGLCILLRLLSYPNQLQDLVPLFGRHVTELSVIANYMLNKIYEKFHATLLKIDHDWMDKELYANAVYAKGAALSNVWAFLDGTQGRVCRPKKGQEAIFNGHKRQHSLKYQSLILPNGIIAHFYGPVEGRRHDSGVYFESGLDQLISDVRNSNGEEMAVYANSAYALRSYLITPFKGANLTQEQIDFNANMSSMRQSVEWGFGKLTNLFAFIGYHKNLKVYLQPVAKFYLVSVLLCNAHTCLYGSETGQYFNVQAPILEDYLKHN